MANLLKRIPGSILLFLFFLSIYLFTMSGVIQYGDEAEKYLVAQSIVERHSFSFHPTVMRNEVGPSGQTYSIYEMGTSLLQVPFYVLGRFFLNSFPTPDPNWITMLAVGLLNPTITAFACVLFFKTLLRFGFLPRTALVLTLTFGLATIAFPYSRGFNREPILTALLLLLLYTATMFDQTQSQGWLIANGVVAGALIFTKLIEAVVLPIILVYVLLVMLERYAGDSKRQLVLGITKTVAVFALPVLLFFSLQSIYSFLRFGTLYGGLGGTRSNPLDMVVGILRAGNPGEMSLRFLFSPARSIFLYSPPIILSLIAWFMWLSKHKKKAWMLLGVILVSFTLPALRPDGDAPGWWGPRYLVQITPFFLFPIGSLLESSNSFLRRLSASALGVLFAMGMVIQGIGVLTNSREHLDILGVGPTLTSQWDFLNHRALDSMLVYFSPIGFPVRVNPFAVMLIVLVLVLGSGIIVLSRTDELLERGSFRYGIATLVMILTIELVGFAYWVVAPYSRILISQANTKYVAGLAFQADHQVCKANWMYLLASSGESDFQKDAALRLNQNLGFQDTGFLASDDLMHDLELEEGTQIDEDESVTRTGDSSLKITVPPNRDATATALSRSITVRPSTSYQLSGWIKLLNVYGTGNAVVSIYEDDGKYTNKRTTDIRSGYQTSGWQPFWGTITTLPTTQRVIIKFALWQTFGTVWINDVHFNQLDSQSNLQPNTLPFCDLKE